MENLLLKNLLLTDYQEWGKRKGCLMYVANEDPSFAGRGAIFLIDAPWRNKQPKLQPLQLNEEEEKQLKETNKVAGGFWAVLLAAGCRNWEMDTYLIEEYWNAYSNIYQHYDDSYEWKNIERECRYWIYRDKEVVAAFLKTQHMTAPLNYLAHQMIRWKLGRRLFDTRLSLADFKPHIRFDNNNEPHRHYRYILFNSIKYYFERADNDNIVLKGYQAPLLNHAATKHVLNEFWKNKDLDSAIPLLLKRLNEPESDLDITDIPLPFYISVREKLQNVYIEWKMSDVDSEVNKMDDYRLVENEPKERDFFKLNYIFYWEMQAMEDNKNFLHCLTAEQQEGLRKLTADFFVSLLVALKGSEFYPAAFTAYSHCFTERRKSAKIQPKLKDTERPTQKDLEKTFICAFRQELGFKLLIETLKEECDRASDKDWARYALAIYETKVLINKPKTFKEWLPEFCNIFGRVWIRYYEPGKLKAGKKKNKIAAFLP